MASSSASPVRSFRRPHAAQPAFVFSTLGAGGPLVRRRTDDRFKLWFNTCPEPRSDRWKFEILLSIIHRPPESINKVFGPPTLFSTTFDYFNLSIPATTSTSTNDLPLHHPHHRVSQWRRTTVTSAPQRTPSFCLRPVALDFYLVCSDGYLRKSASRSSLDPYSYGTSGRQACDAGPMANHGAQAVSQAAS